jgi:RNA polymerase sigma factor (sigma-70 family)
VTLGLDFPATLAAARVGADWAWTNLYRDLAPSILRYLRAHDVGDPDDLLEEVFLQMVQDLPSFSGREDDFRAWAFAIAHRRLLDEWRRTDKHPEMDSDDGDFSTDADSGSHEDEPFTTVSEAHVCAIMARLTTSQREVLFLRIIGGLSIEQTAQALGKTAGSVKALQIRGLQTISRHLPSEVVSK